VASRGDRPLKSVSPFERKAARAELLAGSSQAARDPLRFAAGLYRAQGRSLGSIQEAHRGSALTGRLESDSSRILPSLRPILDFVGREGPGLLAEGARSYGLSGAALLPFWKGEVAFDYLARALLRPYGECLARESVVPDRPKTQGRCPFCGGGPWIAARQGERESEGARRLLGCALCGGEWLVGRILCPNCGEPDPAKLPSFSDERYKEARIEACETCRHYVKSIDLTEDARRIPEVDDLRSLSLDLWAAEQGYKRLEPGLAGF
jgi:formate dehydrogenase maturation protein FdhE